MAKETQELQVKLMQAPDGVTAASHDGKSYKVDKDGRVEVPFVVADALAAHGFTEVKAKR